MPPPKAPAGWEIEVPKKAKAPVPPEGWEIETPEGPAGVHGSPLEAALAAQAGDVVTVQTPTGPTQLTRDGHPFYSPDEAAKVGEAGTARLKERALAGGVSLMSGGLLGAQQAGLGAAMKWPHPSSGKREGESPLDVYRRIRDQTTRDFEDATRHASPVVPVLGHKVPVLPIIGAALPSLLVPNPVTVMGRMGLSGAIGAEQAASSSQADLTRGEVAPLLKDTARGAGTGLLAAGAAEGLSVPMRAITRGAASRIGDAVARQAGKDSVDVAKEVATLRGKLGAESQNASRMFENTQRAAGGGVAPSGQSMIDPALQGRAMLALSAPATVRLQEKVLSRGIGEIPAQTGVVERLEQELSAKSSGAANEAAERTRDFFAKPTIKTDVLPRVGRHLQNAAISTAAAIPAAVVGGLGYGKVGAGAMLAMGASQGLAKGALSAARTTAANPRLQVGALNSVANFSTAAQNTIQSGARAVTPTQETARPQIIKDRDEQAIQAFLSGG